VWSKESEGASSSVERSDRPMAEPMAEGSTRAEQARAAWRENDTLLSIQAHKEKVLAASAKEKHKEEAGETISSIVFGGLDGITTTFAVVAAATAANLSRGVILILGFANLIGDAIGMGIGDFVSSKAEYDHVLAERKREEWEIDNCLEIEKHEMKEIYQRRGLTAEQAAEVVELMLENREVFLDRMMVDELGLLPAEDPKTAAKNAAVTFAAFLFFGGAPLIPYLANAHYSLPGGFDDVFIESLVCFVVALFALGCYRGVVTGKNWLIIGMITLICGAATTAIAWGLGDAFQRIKLS